ncbi:MAG: methionine synthase, partial [Planctomycetales bacterium]|nr:methionine synthase [Planctomycetales bacterium]
VVVAKELKRRQLRFPILIGGATTSAKHTAVKIAPQYPGPVVHVLDASRSVGVVDRLLSDNLRAEMVADNQQLQSQLLASFQERQKKLVSYADACERSFQTDWTSVAIDQPDFLGVRELDNIPLEEIIPYIDWSPFFMAWELKGKYPAIFADPKVGTAAKELFDDAQALLKEIVATRSLQARAVYGFWPAAADGDDIVLYPDDDRKQELCRFHMLRQQWERQGQDCFRSLADYVAPRASGRADYIGAFACTAGLGAESLVAKYEREHDDVRAIMVKALADRLAEALAELLHQRAREHWGYGKNETLSNEQLIQEKYRGIRPAHGYPACPDHTEKKTLFDLLDADIHAGMTLTENFAMLPAASVSGLYFAHPQARYFAVNSVTRDQVEDYARRKGVSVKEVQRWLAPILGYDV